MSGLSDELSQLQAAIAAQEKLRGAVADEVIEATIAALKTRVAEVETAAKARQRRLVTILFMDTVGSTALIRDLDPEESLGIMDASLSRLTGPIEAHGGRVTRFLGDGFKAVFGLPSANENDAEMAVRAGLALLEAARTYALELEETRHIRGYQIRVGIHTGWVAVGGRSEAEGSIMGAAVNMAARMESGAEPGTVLISHDTYQHVRGTFELKPRGAIEAKGFAEPIKAYQVLALKTRASRMGYDGIEGVATRMVGRNHELGMLQDAYLDAFEATESRVVTVVGEAGVGKSRLIYEFNAWLGLRSEKVLSLRGRAVPYLQNVPNALFRDLFASHFDIREDDNPAAVLEKFRNGTAGSLAPRYADLTGQWLGFDLSASDGDSNFFSSTEFSDIARGNLARYFQKVATIGPVVMFLEDMQWADDNSLDLVNYLATTVASAHLLIVTVARQIFFERRPHWGEGQRAYSRVDVKPLSRRLCRALVDEILQQVKNIPDALRDKVVGVAEGNPLYVEEQVKMLFDQGIIEKRASRWRVLVERLDSLNIPSTLTALLQARLDGLPQPEREVLQHASVMGQIFWDEALVTLSSRPGEEVAQILEALRERELIFHRERSTFGGTVEYIFRHSLLRDVAYETVLLERRAELHGRAARWLESSAGERLEESLGLIARHYELGGEPLLAAGYFGRAAESAFNRFTLNEALTSAEKAVSILDHIDDRQMESMRLRHYLLLGQALGVKGDLRKARELLERHLPEVRQCEDPSITVPWLRNLASRAIMLGDFIQGRELLEEGLALARQSGDRQILFDVLLDLGHLGWRTDKLIESSPYIQEALSLAEGLDDRRAVGEAKMLLAFHADMVKGNKEESLELHQQIEMLGREIGATSLIAQSLNNEGYTLYEMGNYQRAINCFEEAMVIEREVGWDQGISYTACRMALAMIQLGQTQEAKPYLKEGLRLALATNRAQTLLYGLLAHALMRLKTGRVTAALELTGLAQSHPGFVKLDHGNLTKEILDEARERVSSEEVEVALASGGNLAFDAVVRALTAGKESWPGQTLSA